MSMISLMISSVMSSVSTYNEDVHIYILFITIKLHLSIQPNIIHRHHNLHVKRGKGGGLIHFFCKKNNRHNLGIQMAAGLTPPPLFLICFQH